VARVALYNQLALERRDRDLLFIDAWHQEERAISRRGGQLGYPCRHGLETSPVGTRDVNDNGTRRGSSAGVRPGASTFSTSDEAGKSDERSEKLHWLLRLVWAGEKWKVSCLSKKMSTDWLSTKDYYQTGNQW
ncbi:hypothetical protein, variant, partial [Phytophthora nicotianae P1569]